MTNKIKISIPEPCHENWYEMSPTEKGKFCSSCQKNVIDFTKSSDRQIIVAYKKEENLCGRFRISQLDREMIIPKEKKSIWILAAASLIAFLGLGNQTAKAQGKIKIEQTDQKQLSDSVNVKSNGKIKYSGVVYDEKNNPLPGAFVSIKNTKNGVSTDIDGKFSIEANKQDVLRVLFVGYKEVDITLKKNPNITIKMKIDEVELQGFSIIKRPEDE
ncbi:carboxypeptidase-like protein [Flavobacterium sp. 90]|uniref:carboxypeptidase-like regulatory domain-containing protein n=1 Tax=Flavobacterium sp. 90 TaxID=2135622 RepID=UPI001052AC4B|nr:carboxypeptidase-like regulatory domain-containing protein [Flavobacterium sp. 90]TCK57328.1 carboxypeptidase-like protein [Flavobacterium sp. 90]